MLEKSKADMQVAAGSLALLVGMTEVWPKYGFSIFPARGEGAHSVTRIESAPRRLVFAMVAWSALISLAYWRTRNPLLFVAGALVAYGLAAQSQQFSCDPNDSDLSGTVAWLAGWILFTLVGWQQLDPRSMARLSLLAGFIAVLLGAFLMTLGRCGARSTDYLGRVLFAAGVVVHQLAYYA